MPRRRIVVDANRILGALLLDGATRHTIMTTDALLFAPRFLRMEIERHKPAFAKRMRANTDDVDAILRVLYRRIVWVSDTDVRRHLVRARKALAGRDPNDVPYLACALAVQADGIWSQDQDFDAQNLVPRIDWL